MQDPTNTSNRSDNHRALAKMGRDRRANAKALRAARRAVKLARRAARS